MKEMLWKTKLYENRFARWRKLLKIASIGLVIAIITSIILINQNGSIFLTTESSLKDLGPVLLLLSAAVMAPWVIYSYFLALVHWKDRYKGPESNAWAVLFMLMFIPNRLGPILLLIYYCKHIIPDMRKKGIYEPLIRDMIQEIKTKEEKT